MPSRCWREGPEAVAQAAAMEAQLKLAAELILLRRKRGLTQRQLSAHSSIQQSKISRIERGREPDRRDAGGARPRARRGVANRVIAGRQGAIRAGCGKRTTRVRTATRSLVPRATGFSRS